MTVQDESHDGHYVAVPPTPTTQSQLDHHRISIPSVKKNAIDPKQSSTTTERQISFSQQENPLSTASLLSVVVTHWLQPLITLGAKKILEKEDIWPICQVDSCDALTARFRSVYNPKSQTPLGMSPVAWAFLKMFRRDLVVVFANYVIYIMMMAMQSILAQAILDFLNDRVNRFHINSGYVLVVMLTCASMTAITTLNYGFFLSSRLGANMRTVIMDVVYQKSLRLSSAARHEYTTGEVMTLMSVDAERVFNAMMQGPWLFCAPFGFLIALALIVVIFDWISALIGAAVIVIVLTISVHQAKWIGITQRGLLDVVDERVKVTSEALQGIRVMKFYAWEESLARRVERIRGLEVQLFRKFHFYQITNSVMLFLTPVFISGTTLGCYVLINGTISVTNAFTLIAVVNICRSAVNVLPLAIAALSQAKIAYARIDRYLCSGELERVEPAVTHVKDSIEKSHELPRGNISIENAHFEWSVPPTASTTDVVIVTNGSPMVDNKGAHNAEEPEATPSQGFSLEGVNMEIDAGSLVMIVGVVGSGKSSLLNALLGEMNLKTGSMTVNGEVSYVSQESWIRNSSVKDNILFESPYDPDLYEKVLEAAQLATDLNALPNGDQTEIGERGINLSGGQKARVSIARAMYRSNYDILILDDPLSAVDPHVAHAIFDQCIVGLAKDKTRLLVLNSHYDLLSRADKIFVIEHGRITGDGTYEEILAQFPDLYTKTEVLDDIENDVIDEHDQEEIEALKMHAAAEALVVTGDDHSKANHPLAADEDNRLIKDEDRVKGEVSGQTYMTYFNETGYNGVLVIIVIIIAYASSQGMRTLVDWWQGHWASRMLSVSYNGTAFGMWYLAFIILCTVLTVGRSLLVIEACIRSASNLHDELFRRVLKAPINRYFDVTPMGRILNRFSNDLDQMDSILPPQYQLMFQNMALCVGCLIVSASSSIWIGVSYIPMIVIFVLTGQYFKKTSREVKRLEGITRTPVFNLFGETLSGLQTIRAFKMEDAFVERNKKVVDENTSLYFMYWAAGRWLAVRLDWLSVVIIFVVSLYIVATKGQITPVVAGISLTYSLMLTSMMQSTVRAVDRTDNAMTSAERLLHFREIPQEDDGVNCTPINSELWPSQGTIRFDNLHLRYRPELPLVLRGVNMEIGAGEKVGICGRTGAGKSSLMIALFRICEFDSGTVWIDGLDIKNVKLHDLRRSLAIIPQDPVLYSGSLRENLDPFGDYSDDMIWAVLQHVHLAESVKKWGAGLEFVVSECGDNLSVGQRQLLCIGRALLKNCKIVVMDEATANVDTATDSLIQETIKDTFVSKTVLIIAHRINTIMHCDKIAVMDAGQVAEFGSPSSLLSQPDSIFGSLAKKSSEA